MNIDTPLRELGPIDTTALSEAILAQDDVAWKEDKYRQEEFEVHHATESIVVLFVDLDKWPDLVVSKEPGWPRIADQALPIMDEIIRKFYPPGGTVIRAMAAKLLAGGIINPHTDRHPSFRFMIDGRPYQFKVGEAYEINNQMMHSVMNKGTEDRIPFIFDYVPPDQIEALHAA